MRLACRRAREGSGALEDMAPPEEVQSGAIRPEPVLPAAPDVSPLDQRDRYQLMLRFYLTPAQIDMFFRFAPRLVMCNSITYDVQVNIPLNEMRMPTYYVLASLLDGPLHGYAIMKRTAELSDGRVRLATGTLYQALDRLTAEGRVELVREEIVNGRVRRSYGLTDSGIAELRAEASRMAAAARLVQTREHRLRGRAGGRALPA
jgi:PadR family transcriptional regulator PadR